MDLTDIVKKAIARFPAEKIKEYRAGKTGLLGAFVGEAMILCKGTANPKHLLELVKVELESIVV